MADMTGRRWQVDSVNAASLLAAHMTATEVFESVTSGGASDFAGAVTILNRHKLWCLIGGLAVNCYAEPVYTIDVDLVVMASNLEQIGREFEASGLQVKPFEDSMNAQRPGSKLNIQFTTDPRYQEFLADATEREVLGMQVPVARLKDIIRGKVWAWKDELDLIRIAEANPGLQRLIPEEITKQL